MPQRATRLDKHERPKSQVNNRNRENQRNFRARRQQYVQELEQKVRACEAARVEATKRVQVAAQLVVSENRVLRQLLLDRLGMSGAEIDNHVQRARTMPSDSQPSITRGCKDPSQSKLELSPSSVPSSVVQATTPAPRHPEDDTQTHAEGPTPSIHPHTTLIVSQGGAPTALLVDSESPATYKRDTNCSTRLSGSDPHMMSCDEAAQIISSIRAHSTIADVREELGCTVQEDNCAIQNADVLEALNAWI